MRNPTQTAAEMGVVPEDELPSIVARFDEQIADLDVTERNERRLVEAVRDGTIAWYERNLRARTGRVLAPDQRRALAEHLDMQAPGLVAGRNADQLASELSRLEADMATSGLGTEEVGALRAEAQRLRSDLLRDGHYHREHDDALERMASIVKMARGAWANDHVRTLDRYRERDRWWLR